jgi:hypothetical protein
MTADHVRLERAVQRAHLSMHQAVQAAEACQYEGVHDDLWQIMAELTRLGDSLISLRPSTLRGRTSTLPRDASRVTRRI